MYTEDALGFGVTTEMSAPLSGTRSDTAALLPRPCGLGPTCKYSQQLIPTVSSSVDLSVQTHFDPGRPSRFLRFDFSDDGGGSVSLAADDDDDDDAAIELTTLGVRFKVWLQSQWRCGGLFAAAAATAAVTLVDLRRIVHTHPSVHMG